MKKIIGSGSVKREVVESCIDMIASGTIIDQKYQDHPLVGEWIGHRECHIKPDLLLIYKIEKDVLILLLADIGSHAHLFDK